MFDDYSLISQLVAKERQYRVRHDPKLADCYYSDAMVTTSWQKGDLQSFLHGESKEVDHRFPIVCNVSTPVIHLNGKKAYVELPTNTRMRMVVHDILVEIESFRRLIYRVEKRHDNWKISSMISINESDNLRPVIPGQVLKVDPKRLSKYRMSYQFLSYVWEEAGGQISHDLLGIDRPKEVEKIYQDAEKWLKK